MKKTSSQLQAEGIAAMHRGECTPAAPVETDEQFLLRHEQQARDWPPTMALSVNARDLGRLVAVARERKGGYLTACSIIRKQHLQGVALTKDIEDIIRRWDQCPDTQGPAAVLANLLKKHLER